MASGAAPSHDEYLSTFEDLTEQKDRGILKKIIREGTTEIRPCIGDTVVVHYVGTYYGGDHHGEQFDSSRDRNEKFQFQIGKGDVIKAWDVGVATMKLGEVCELVAAPEYGYKDDKTMKFEIELFDTKGLDVSAGKDGSVRKSVLEKGRDILTPTIGFEATVCYKLFGDSDSATFTEASYIVGDPASSNVPACVDLAVRQMNTAERCLVRVHGDANQCAASGGDVRQGDEAVFEVKLKSFEKAKHLSSLSGFDEQMAYAEEIKTKANDYLKNSKYPIAIAIYQRLDEDLQYIVTSGVEQQKTSSELITAVQLNLALAYLKLGDAAKCSEMCRKVLDQNASNEKALFRLGQACLLKKDHEEAASYFKRVVEKNPQNTSAVNQLRICEEVIRAVEQKERKVFKGIFDRFKETGLESKETSDIKATKAEEDCKA